MPSGSQEADTMNRSADAARPAIVLKSLASSPVHRDCRHSRTPWRSEFRFLRRKSSCAEDPALRSRRFSGHQGCCGHTAHKHSGPGCRRRPSLQSRQPSQASVITVGALEEKSAMRSRSSRSEALSLSRKRWKSGCVLRRVAGTVFVTTLE